MWLICTLTAPIAREQTDVEVPRRHRARPRRDPLEGRIGKRHGREPRRHRQTFLCTRKSHVDAQGIQLHGSPTQTRNAVEQHHRSRPAWPQRRQGVGSESTPVDVSACTMATTRVGPPRRSRQPWPPHRLAGRTPIRPAPRRHRVAPPGLPIRPPNTPLIAMTIRSPGATRFVIVASIPALPVPGNRQREPVRGTKQRAQVSLHTVHQFKEIWIEVANQRPRLGSPRSGGQRARDLDREGEALEAGSMLSWPRQLWR